MVKDRTKAQMRTTPFNTCMKILLTVFNFIFWITGCAILGLGVWMKVDLYRFMQLTTVYYAEAPYILMGIGGLIILVGGLGCCCTFKGHGRLLYMYALFLVIVFIAELSAGIAGFVYRQKLEEGFKSGLEEALKKYGTKGDKDNEKQRTIDELQKSLQCCGIQNYTDWFATPWEASQKHPNSVPASCCQADGCKAYDLPPKYAKSTVIHAEGCHDLVVKFLEKNIGVVGGIAIGISFIQLIGVALTCLLARGLNKANYENIA